MIPWLIPMSISAIFWVILTIVFIIGNKRGWFNEDGFESE